MFGLKNSSGDSGLTIAINNRVRPMLIEKVINGLRKTKSGADPLSGVPESIALLAVYMSEVCVKFMIAVPNRLGKTLIVHPSCRE